MQINNNLNTNVLMQNMQQLNVATEAFTKLSLADDMAGNTEVTDELIEQIAGQVASPIAYQAGAKSIEIQKELTDSLVNIRA